MKKFLQISHKSLDEFGVSDYKSLWQKAQSEGYIGMVATVEAEFTKSVDANNIFHAIFSSAKEDRHWDVVHQEFDLKAFKKNPVFLDSHNYNSIEHILGKIKRIGVEDGKLQGDIEFMIDNPKGELARKMAEQGFLRATSIGFIPKEFNEKGEILKSELLEISGVSVPANADAIFEEKAVTKAVEEVKVEEKKVVVTPPPVVEKKSVIDVSKAVLKMAEDQRALLKSIAKAVQELTEENKMSKKREIHKALRSLLG